MYKVPENRLRDDRMCPSTSVLNEWSPRVNEQKTEFVKVYLARKKIMMQMMSKLLGMSLGVPVNSWVLYYAALRTSSTEST